MGNTIPVYQEILLLALDDEKGTTGGGMFLHAMGGAMLAELVARGSIRIDKDKKKLVHAMTSRPPGDGLLDECMAMIHKAGKPKKAADWVAKFAGIKDLKHRAAALLVEAGVLEEETGTVLKIFKRRIYPASDPGPEKDLRDRMHRAIFTGSSQVETETIMVIALARAAGMLDKVFPKKQLKERKQRLEKLCKGQISGAATREAVEAVQTAILVATIVPAIVTTSTTAGR